jgi:hypothetical protein
VVVAGLPCQGHAAPHFMVTKHLRGQHLEGFPAGVRLTPQASASLVSSILLLKLLTTAEDARSKLGHFSRRARGSGKPFHGVK